MNFTRDINSLQVLIRFTLRVALLAGLSAIGHQGYGKTFEALLSMTAFYCVFVAMLRREAPLGRALTHFDEAAAYLIIGRLAVWTA